MPLVEEIDPNSSRSKASTVSSLRAGAGDGAPNISAAPDQLPAELDAWRKANPAAFEELMAATLAATAAGDDPEATMRRLEAVLAHQQAAQVASDGLELPGQRGKVGLDGSIKANVIGIDITPTPAFVVKASRLDSAGTAPAKVFLNICSHSALGEPHLKKKLDDQGQEIEGWNIPLGVGPPRLCTDHKGDQAVVYDCVVNPKVGTKDVWPCSLCSFT